MFIEKRFYSQVGAQNHSHSEYVLSEGEKIFVTTLGGNAVYSNNVKVEIIKNPGDNQEILFATHGDNIQSVNIEISYPAIIDIKLTNDTLFSETIGAYWQGEKYFI